jgi:transcriptional regulator with XRE-family HTH domain
MYGEQIKNFLDENGIKYSFVASEAGISNNIFSAMLNGKRKITVEEYFSICHALKVDANYFAEKVNKH